MKTRSMYGGAKVALVVAMVVLGALGAGLLSLYGFVNSVRNEGVGLETQLNAQYLANQNELSTFVSSFYEQVGVANLKSEKMDQIITDAVKGRYEGDGGGGYGQGSPFFSAIVESYPDVKSLDIYDKIVSFVQSGRESYKNKQDKLLDQMRAYDTWRRTGLVRSQVVATLGFPSENLEARVGAKVVTGAAAREQMLLIVTTSDTKKAYETGTMEPLKVPSN